jgi:hypothetical protein
VRELARRGDPVLLDLAERLDLRAAGGAAPFLRGPVLELGPAALPRARVWTGSDDAWLRDLGRSVLCAHGGPTDGTTIVGWLDGAVAEGAWCVTEECADGLARLGHRAALPSLRRAWELTEHSYARQYHLAALVRLDAPAVGELLAEAVDDCETGVRRIAHDPTAAPPSTGPSTSPR